MGAMRSYALLGAGVLALAAGCAGRQQQQAGTPTGRAVESAQAESEAAIKRAAEAQRRASEQGERVATAQTEVRTEQERLVQAQERLRQEQTTAEQLQREALEATRESSRQAERAQREAARALARQGEYVEKGQQTFSGQVTESGPDRIVVTPQVGEPMTFRVTQRTRVQIDGRKGSAAEIEQGGDARVAYEVSGLEPTAIVVQVMTGDVEAATRAAQPEGSPREQAKQPAAAPQGR